MAQRLYYVQLVTTWTDDIVAALEDLGGFGTYAQIYKAVASRRSDLPPTWKNGVQRTIQDKSSDSSGFKGASDLFYAVEGLGNGVWGLRAAPALTPSAVDLPSGNDAPTRKPQQVYRILRDTELARRLKTLHHNQCQLCGLALELPGGRFYAEAHHIIPLGKDHLGPDTPDNVIVLCPNHHALCDYGAIKLERDDIRVVSGHVISEISLQYHNDQIYGVRRE